MTTRRWLLLLAAAVVVQIGLGGITRLTDSGLSITEWKPLLGVIPPLNDQEWDEAFAKYQQLPQYKQLKSHLTAREFRSIYFWEWLHRLWGRVLGLAFVVPALIFWRRKQLSGRVLLGLLALGLAQGALGWFMVMSGLQDLVYVSHWRLAAHFLLALGLLAALLALARAPLPARAPRWLLALVVAQLGLGALTAGLKAALYAPTWPTLNGAWLPPEWSLDAPLPVQFFHRTLGLVVLAAITAWWWRSRAHEVLALAWAQVALGIAVLLNAPHAGRLLALGVAHQLLGTLLFAALLWSSTPRSAPLER